MYKINKIYIYVLVLWSPKIFQNQEIIKVFSDIDFFDEIKTEMILNGIWKTTRINAIFCRYSIIFFIEMSCSYEKFVFRENKWWICNILCSIQKRTTENHNCFYEYFPMYHEISRWKFHIYIAYCRYFVCKI